MLFVLVQQSMQACNNERKNVARGRPTHLLGKTLYNEYQFNNILGSKGIMNVSLELASELVYEVNNGAMRIHLTPAVETLLELLRWRESFVVAPLFYCLLNVVLASGFSQIAVTENPVLSDKGLRLIGLLSTASISILTLTFSLTVLSVQIAAQSYSPRLIDDFIKDPFSKIVISVNVGAYVYCFTIQYFIDGVQDDARVSRVAVNFLSVHFALVIFAFVNFIHIFIDGFRIERILSRASYSSLNAARTLSAELNSDNYRSEEPDVPINAYKIVARKSGYVTHFMLQDLVDMADSLDIRVRYHREIGEFVNEGSLLCYIWDAKTRREEMPLSRRVLELIKWDENDTEKQGSLDDQVARKLAYFANDGVNIASRRLRDLDITLGIQQLADIAVRALSPGINDPHTAIQCMDVLSSLFSTLGTMKLGVPNARDKNDVVRLYSPERSFPYLLSLLDGIRRYGNTDITVCRRGFRLFGDLGTILTRSQHLDRVPAVLSELEQWFNVSRGNFPQDSQELRSLQELYDHLLKTIAQSDHLQIRSDDSVAPDVQDLDVACPDADQDEKSIDTRLEKESNVILSFIEGITTSSRQS